ncbi:TetR family transcriptional regulator [Kribbella sp. VKM Ac-2527]|uniref:TetR family transcriptional regulator n=1 Tax=Kribbella caucasensis TaxID=2512215 RepID=A0A4R6JE10_9ACTN|nr:TetR/AcrR family transcriptional regulator [Kribbella sp. VKM Ac-2527]TDO33832.1 TetR family transcriptional regulator [Kribbella sp. VKM Ac-2527]
MPRNPERRAQLADAGLAVLAESGARGLTHRAVDAAAGLPAGTASNYFRSRDALLGALGERIFERLAPDEERLAPLAEREPSVELVVDYVRYIVERLLGRSELTLALLELRLEATRRPELHEILTRTLQQGFDTDISFHVQAGLPGGAEEVRLLRFAIEGLVLDQLTPGTGRRYDVDAITARLVRRLIRADE